MNSHKLLAAAAALLVTAAATTANAAISMDKAAFNALLINPTTIDFDGIAPVAGVGRKTVAELNALYAGLGVTFSTGGNFQDSDRHSANYPTGTPSDWLCLPCIAGAAVTISFSNEVQPLIDGVGFNVALAQAGQVSVQVFNGADLLESAVFDAETYPTFGTYFGVYGDGPITSVTISALDHVGLGIDNLVFGDPPAALRDPIGAPEPMSIAILGLGLTGMGLLRRRRTTQG